MGCLQLEMLLVVTKVGGTEFLLLCSALWSVPP